MKTRIKYYTNRECGLWTKTSIVCRRGKDCLMKLCKKLGWHSLTLSDKREFDVINGYRAKKWRTNELFEVEKAKCFEQHLKDVEMYEIMHM
jgi:hypothetical protein